MAKIPTFLAGAAVGAAVGAAAGTVLRPHLRTIAKTALTGYYVGRRRAVELASLVAEELEDLHAEVVSEEQTGAAGTVTADDAAFAGAAASVDLADIADQGSTEACEPEPVVEQPGEPPPRGDGYDEVSCEGEARSFEDMTVRELRDELIRLGVSLGSRVKKADLIARLRAIASTPA